MCFFAKKTLRRLRRLRRLVIINANCYNAIKNTNPEVAVTTGSNAAKTCIFRQSAKRFIKYCVFFYCLLCDSHGKLVNL